MPASLNHTMCGRSASISYFWVRKRWPPTDSISAPWLMTWAEKIRPDIEDNMELDLRELADQRLGGCTSAGPTKVPSGPVTANLSPSALPLTSYVVPSLSVTLSKP